MAVDASEPIISILLLQELYGSGFSTYICVAERNALLPRAQHRQGGARFRHCLTRDGHYCLAFLALFRNHNLACSGPLS